MNYYIDAIKKYATFSGRATRSEYWFFVLFNIIIAMALAITLSVIAYATNIPSIAYLSYAYSLFVFLPSIACEVRRLHDINKSGAWFFISLIPVIGSIWMLVLMCLDSVNEGNNY